MKFFSPAFQDGCLIPRKYTCEGEELSPPLEIQEIPKEAKSLVLIMDDPDVPKHLRKDGMWVHWVLFNIPKETRTIEENRLPEGTLGMGTGMMGYQGPCPPDREHRYFFKLYALDTWLNLKEGSTKEDVEKAMEGHILELSSFIGRYEKGQKKHRGIHA